MKEENKSFIKMLITISMPVVLQQLLQSSLTFVDTVMIGRLGETEIAAVGLAGQIYFFISVIIFGVASGESIFTSQYWGSGNKEGIQKTFGLSLTAGVAFSSVFAVLSVFFPAVLMKIFIKDVSVVNLGCDYLRWVGFSYIFVAVSQVISVVLRSTGDTKRPMYITLISVLTDVVGNYYLIFVAGLGVSGAAMATAVSRLIEMVLLLYVMKFKSPVPPVAKQMFSFDGSFAKDVLKTGAPAMIDDAIWALGMTIYKAVFARMGVAVLAAANVSESVQNLFFVTQLGVGAGVSVIIGNTIGRREYEKAKIYARKSVLFGVLLGAATTVLMALTSPVIPGLFNVGSEVLNMTRVALLALSFTLPVKYFNHIFICGVARSGGDTRFSLYVELFSIYCIGVPAAIIGGIILGLPLWAVYLMVCAEEVTKAFFCIPRLFNGRWVNDLVN